MTVLELFCGIGGCAAALGPAAHVVAAVDQNLKALEVYRLNFAHPVESRAVETIPARRWREWGADLWWMSPPCTPFTMRGHRRDLDDPRARGFLAVLERIGEVRPHSVALENVPGFVGSRGHVALREALAHAGYDVRECVLCPTELGLPNRRQRFYLLAGLGPLPPWPPKAGQARRVAEVLDAQPDPALLVDPAITRRYARALHVVDADDPAACTSCFTSAYGRSFVRSGSYLGTPAGLRRFSPREILRLLDFPEAYRLPPSMSPRAAWPLVGNSVSVRAVRWVLNTLGSGLYF
jgi:site-specific DNA-cytosine methylase